MLKLKRFYNQNRKKIWKITGIIVFFYMVLQFFNYLAGKNNDIEYYSNEDITEINQKYTDLSVTTDESVLSQQKISKTQQNSLKVIDEFFSYCNKQDFEKAYSLLTEECKEQLYPNITEFEEGYYKEIYDGKKKNISVENWTGNIYKITIEDDLLTTGVYNNGEAKQDYITLKKEESGEYKLNINSYIGREKLNKTTEFIYNIEAKVVFKDIYMDYEVYTFEIKNPSNGKILIDPLNDINSMYLIDENDIKYYAYTHEISKAELLINAGETRTFEVKFYNKYTSNRNIEGIIFSKVMLDYHSTIDYSLESNYRNFRIDI